MEGDSEADLRHFRGARLGNRTERFYFSESETLFLSQRKKIIKIEKMAQISENRLEWSVWKKKKKRSEM